jgi:hypothetical protein
VVLHEGWGGGGGVGGERGVRLWVTMAAPPRMQRVPLGGHPWWAPRAGASRQPRPTHQAHPVPDLVRAGVALRSDSSDTPAGSFRTGRGQGVQAQTPNSIRHRPASRHAPSRQPPAGRPTNQPTRLYGADDPPGMEEKRTTTPSLIGLAAYWLGKAAGDKVKMGREGRVSGVLAWGLRGVLGGRSGRGRLQV